MKFTELDQASFWQILQLTQAQGKYVLETFKAKTDAFMDRFEDAVLVTVNRVLEFAAPIAVFLWLFFTFPAVATWRFLKWLFTLPWDMNNRVVLVLGASSGIGAFLAYEYAKLGARLSIVARREEKLEDVAERCRRLGSPDVLVVQADVSQEEGCKQAVDTTLRHFRRLDALVLAAAVGHIYYFEEAEDTRGFRQIMDVNFWSYVYTTKFALPALLESQGQIVAVDSCTAFINLPAFSLYNASKAAVTQFFETLRVELGDCVPITVLFPGVVKTELTDGKVILPTGEVASPLEGAELRKVTSLLRAHPSPMPRYLIRRTRVVGAPDVRREKGGFGLAPVIPAPYFAKRAVKAARYRRQRAVIPSWYSMALYLQVFQPEVLLTVLGFLYRGRPSVAKIAMEALGGGVKHPGGKEFKEAGYRKGG
ncbi:short chain dehydrogenase reductase [Klebsormidium nitens]|uniref:Short chain dehydrogenase reductase n=1 Tax=Klebsormidium nitens TaxID=105231 RepID=A0A1Y1HV32_KLENI|nr:short chain dehydrogenase reductase [Klebsormidium nitens]|eukprot:GAQ81049.1 short chain dehydrogenase reductase [Klebsormidium nitens]